MIVDLPSQSDFFANAESLLHFAWGHATELLVSLAEIKELEDTHGDSPPSPNRDEYWQAANQTLVSAYSVVQQATEFFLKGRIAEVSPYLLLSGTPSSWPKGCDKTDTAFSEFRTVEAQDLLRLHDVLVTPRLTDGFRTWYEEMRRERNRIMHMVHSNVSISPEKLILSILKCHDYFIGPRSWVSSRLKVLDRSPENSIEYIRNLGQHKGYSRYNIHRELGAVFEILKPKEVREYFDHDKRSKSFKCPDCHNTMSEMDYFESDHHAEYLHPYQKRHDSFRCFVCGYEGMISNDYCVNRGCGEHTIDEKYSFCIVCGCLDVVEDEAERD